MESHWITPPPPSFKGSNGIHTGAGLGHLFVVLAIIGVLGVLAGFLGRACGGRHWGGETEYDFEGWVERKCAICIDGEIDTCEEEEADPKPVENGTAEQPPPAADAAVNEAPPQAAEDGGGDQPPPEAPPPEGEAKPPEAEGGGEGGAAPPPPEESKPPEAGCEGGG